MQVINSYADHTNIRLVQQVRLYHISRPNLRRWRQTRHGKKYQLDATDQWIIKNIPNNNLTLVDCAGWYFEQFDVTTVCLESDRISKYYWPACHVEPDIFTHRPTYISDSDPVIFKYSWFLKYATVENFVSFLNVWVKSTTVINFNPIYIQHNHLKHNLLDLITPMVSFKIQEINNQLWVITP
jgi:hypothetical protein